MEKVLVLVKRAPGVTREAFAKKYLAAARWAAETALEGPTLVVSIVDIPAKEAGLRPDGEPVFDAVAELWLAHAAAYEPWMVAADEQAVGESHAYLVEEFVEREYDRDWPAGERSPGVKSFYFAGRRDDMTHEEFATYWGERHVPLALKHHVGMWRYARNVVTRPLTPDAPDWDGFAVLHFRTAQDLRERFYDSDEGRAAIAADVARFGARGRVLYTSEYILRG